MKILTEEESNQVVNSLNSAIEAINEQKRKIDTLEEELLKHQELVTWIDEQLEIDSKGNIYPSDDFAERLIFKIEKLK